MRGAEHVRLPVVRREGAQPGVRTAAEHGQDCEILFKKTFVWFGYLKNIMGIGGQHLFLKFGLILYSFH